MRERIKWYIGLCVAILNDANDIIGFGSVPVIGDILDAVTSAYLWPLLNNKERALTFMEFIPYADYLPTYTAVLLWSWDKHGPGSEEEDGKSKLRKIPVH